MKNILKDYEEQRQKYLSLEQTTNSLLSNLISTNDINVHSITSRTKTHLSLAGKVARPDKNYSQLDDITDLVGIRVTTYFSDEVDEIAKLIADEFQIDEDNSIDKRRSQEPDRFGYMSLHLVVSYAENRTQLKEYQRFKNIRFEIQIRSILQHAWAEIEHDIGYKSAKQVPDQLKRRFSRLSGLLELADEEFLAIKNSLNNYKVELPKKLNSIPETVSLDLNSLESLVVSNKFVISIEDEVKKEFDCELTDPSEYVLTNSLEFLSLMGFENIGEVIDSIKKYEKYFVPFVRNWLSRNSKGNDDGKKWDSIERGISILYLTYMKLADSDNDDLFRKVLGSAPFLDVDQVISDLKEVWKVTSEM